MLDSVQLRAHAQGVRASHVLGRSPLMHRLFDFLLECSLAGRTPKEMEVGVEVFGKQVASEGAPDAMVRVYIHKLRRKLHRPQLTGAPDTEFACREYDNQHNEVSDQVLLQLVETL